MRLFAVLVVPAAVVCAAMGGCSSNDAAAVDASVDSFGVRPGVDAGSSDGGADSQTNAWTTMRLAHMSADLGPVDFCWRLAGSATFNGPVLGAPADGGATAGDGGDDGASGDAADSSEGAIADATVDAGMADAADGSGEAGSLDAAPVDSGVPGAITFGAMTRDVTLPTSGTFDIALVAAGATSCFDRKLLVQVTLDAGKRVTVVVMGLMEAEAGSDAALSLVAFNDETVDPQTAHVRIIHAALGWPGGTPAPSLSVSAGSVVLAGQVDPRQAGTPSTSPAVDASGYVALPGMSGPAPIRLQSIGDAASYASSTDSVNLGILPGTTHTGFIFSRSAVALGVAWCGDSSGQPVSCQLLPAH